MNDNITNSLEKIASTNRSIFRALASGVAFKVGIAACAIGIFFANTISFEKLTDHVAIVEIKGEIRDGALTSYEAIAPLLSEAFENEHAKKIIIKLSSPGGSPDQSLMIYDKINQLKAATGKPVDAVVTELCASGCYFIASAADNIYSQKTSIIGSIGVITKGFDFTDAMSQWGVKSRTITAGENKAFMDPFQKMTDAQVDFWQDQLQETHKVFIDAVKLGRGEKLAQDADKQGAFSGLVYAAPNAKKLGLIDGYATIDQLAEAQNLQVAHYNLGMFSQKNFAASAQTFLANTAAMAMNHAVSLSIKAE